MSIQAVEVPACAVVEEFSGVTGALKNRQSWAGVRIQHSVGVKALVVTKASGDIAAALPLDGRLTGECRDAQLCVCVCCFWV